MKIQDTWRITEEEFYERALDYLVDHVLRIKAILVKDPKYFTNEKTVKLINTKILEVGNEIATIKSNNHGYYTKRMKKDLIKSLLDICILDVKDWSAFSLNRNNRLDEIMLRILLNVVYNKSYVCYCYISSNKNMCEAFIDDVLYVTSGIFSFDDWDDEHVAAVSHCIINTLDPKESKDMIRLYGKKFVNSIEGVKSNPNASTKSLNPNKLDFKCIIDEIQDDNFKEKYASLLIKK